MAEYYSGKMRLNKYGYPCVECGKIRPITKTYGYRFETMDGGDHIEQEYCLLCLVRVNVHHLLRVISEPIKRRFCVIKMLVGLNDVKLANRYRAYKIIIRRP